MKTVATVSTPRRARSGWRGRFLAEFAISANVTAACRSVGVHRSAVYHAKHRSPKFAAAWADAEEQARDRIRSAIDRRAVDGWLEPVFGKDGQVGEIRRYSDPLLARLAAAHCPEYREKSSAPSSVTVNNTANITIQISAAELAGFQAREKLALEALTSGRN